MLWLLGQSPPPPPDRYSQFLDQLQGGQVAVVQIGADAIAYALKRDRLPVDEANGQRLGGLEPFRELHTTVPVPGDRALVPLLRQVHVRFAAVLPAPTPWWNTVLSWILPAVVFLGIWMFMARRAGGPLAVGQSHARIYAEGQIGVTFADVAGVDEAKAELEEVVDFLRHADKYARVGAHIPKGVLLVGPPGTGKTLLAKAVAGQAGVPFYSISGSEFIELFVGVGASRVRDLFAQAKAKAPCIIFIDELDALGKSRTAYGGMVGGNDEREQTLNQLLSEMDGFEPNTGVIILAATNRPEVLDPALRRPGRFDRVISVDPPDWKGRAAILRVHVKAVPLSPEVDLEGLARRTPGFVGADLANLVNEAALLAARVARATITMADLNEAIERVVGGLEKKSRILSEPERTRVAHHEAGHAVVGALMPGAHRVEKISIVPRGLAALGYTWQVPFEERFLLQEDELRGRLATLMGGRAAERVIFGKLSTGAGDDLQKATDLAEQAVTLYGMSRLGPVTYERMQPSMLDATANPRRAMGPGTAERVDAEMRRLLEEAETSAAGVVRHNEAIVRALADELLNHEVLEGETLRTLLAQAALPLSA
ncbi:MAG TPA: ATP-dependent zinc metalloprotease FtsH [Candidatus Xenobia bacterium]